MQPKLGSTFHQTLDAWEAIDGPSGGRGDLMRMAREESDILLAVAKEHPELAAAAGSLGKRYAEFAKRYRTNRAAAHRGQPPDHRLANSAEPH